MPMRVLILSLGLLFLPVSLFAQTTAEQDYQIRLRQLEHEAAQRGSDYWTNLVYEWAARYGGTIVKPQNFRVRKMVNQYVVLSNGLRCRVRLSPLCDRGFFICGMECLPPGR